eukprot:TRINITY_DN32139_c0_g1_i1.p1 TRINITY_DN32139_c0_g1~~TRINITY_DN32139_c0_g1_i1.p1  ORF type:complete len:290 (+),score=98.50 TRINITY_DN32139_c0_g1_i1:49-918(+)
MAPVTVPSVLQRRPRAVLSPMENLAVGAAGGALETTLQMPVITYKFCKQEGRALPTSAGGFYRGVGVQAGTVAPITALQFLCNGALQTMLKAATGKAALGDVEVIAAATAAGGISAIVYSPVDMITIQQQKLNMSPVQTARHIIAKYGYANGFFRGFGACAVREGIYTAGYLGLAPVATARLAESGIPLFAENPLLTNIAGACIAGVLAAAATHPADTTKTVVQADLAGTTYPTARAAFAALTAQHGYGAMCKAFLPRTARVCGAFTVCQSLRHFAIEYKTSCDEAASA